MREIGTMKNFREKLNRKNVTAEKVTKSYKGCEQFLLSFGKAYICIAAMEFWGLENLMLKLAYTSHPHLILRDLRKMMRTL